MNPCYAKAVIFVASVAMVAIRAPHGRRSRTVPVARSGKGTRETILLTLAWAAFFVTVIWIVTPAFDFADYPLHPIPLVAGAVPLALGLWLFYRSHADLGTNWSITLEVRDKHQLVTHGVYRWARHPMYLALLLYSAGQALALPNWFAGPSYGVAMVVLFAFRVGAEERLMREAFGEDYERYSGATKRLVPGVW